MVALLKFKNSKIASSYNLLLIEDAAEALGSILDNNLAGTFSDAATFSFLEIRLLLQVKAV